jgi:hypothetical protein
VPVQQDVLRSGPTKSGEPSETSGNVEGSKEGKAGLRVIRGRGRLENRFIEEERRERRNKIRVEIRDMRGLRNYDR